MHGRVELAIIGILSITMANKEQSFADQYREKDSGEIESDQRQLARYKAEHLQTAWWEWSAGSHQFCVSEEWENTTGYKAGDVFPVKLSRSMPIEPMLDDLIRAWTSYAHPDDAQTVEQALNQFLRYNATDNKLDIAYRFRRPEGKYIFIRTKGQSKWKGDRLQSVFCYTSDLTGVMGQIEAATALKKQDKRIKAAESSVAKLEKVSKFLTAAFPIVSAVLVAVNTEIPGWIEQGKRFISLVSNPALTDSSAEGLDENAVFSQLSESDVSQVKLLIEAFAPYAESVQLASYSPLYLVSPYPAKYKVLISAAQDPQNLPIETDEPISILESSFITNRTKAHTSGQAFSGSPTGDVSKQNYSVGFSVPVRGVYQLFYVELVDAKSDTAELRSQKLAIEMQALLTRLSED